MDVRTRSLSLVFATALISGTSVFFNGLLVKTMTPSIFTFMKNTTVALLIIALLLATKEWKGLKKLKKYQWLQLAVIGLVGGCIPFFLFFQGLSMTTGTMGAFIHKTLFVYIAILAVVFLRERLHPLWFLGALCLLVGNAIYLNVDLTSFSGPHLLILAATVFWAVENTLSKHVLKSLSPGIVIFGRMGFGALFMALYLLVTGDLFTAGTALTAQNLLAIGLTGIFLFAYVLTWYTGIQHIPVSTAACVLLLGSPATSLLSALFVDTTLTPHFYQGTGMLVLGTCFVLYAYWQTRFQSALSTA